VSAAWSRIEPPDQLGIFLGSLVWTGRELLRFGLSSSDNTVALAAVYNPATARWRRGAEVPLPPTDAFNGTPGSQSVAWTGDQLIAFAGALGQGMDPGPTAMLAYDAQADRWQRLPDAPTSGYHPDLVWAGDRVLLRADRLYELPLTGG
ncbi:MAG: hypothetical protein H0U26_05760, partial [Acidimicrobiia bacterium]|nr:hypothetical protein [Acidimicrobiia bacterium]